MVNRYSTLRRTARKAPARRTRALNGYLFMVPWVVGFLLFKLIPIIASFVFSLTNFHMLEPASTRFVGIDNYVTVFNDRSATSTLSASLSYALLSIPLQVGCAIGLAAVLTSQRLRGKAFARFLLFVPSIIPATAVFFLWRDFLDPNGGWLNPILKWLHIPTSSVADILYDGNLLRAFQALWGIGPGFLIMYGALQSVPPELYEAAKLDGAGPFVRLFRVTLPIASPAIFFSLVINLVASFGGVALLDRGTTFSHGLSPYDDYISLEMFQNFKVGYASSLAWVFFVMIFVVTALLFWSSRWWVYFPDEH